MNYCQLHQTRSNNVCTFQKLSSRTSPRRSRGNLWQDTLLSLRSVVAALCPRLLVLCLALVPLSAFGFSDWQQPTPDELKMTSDPAAPNAPAVYLFREETVNDDLHMHSMYARIKILTEKGRETFSDIEIPYEATKFDITDIGGRTIHADGTMTPLTTKPFDKLVVKAGNYKVMAKVFSMPDVRVGSIVEYRWKLRYDEEYLVPPRWYIAQPIYVHKAHYHFVPTGARGFGSLFYSGSLPVGVKMREGHDGYDLYLENIPALPDEDYMPPFRSFSYRMIFYYSSWRTPDEYWESRGKDWSKELDHFANPSTKIREAVQQIISPADTDRQKVEKIYAAIMKIENMSFTRTRSAQENKAEGL